MRLSNARSVDEFPLGCEVHLSSDGRNWGDPVMQGHGIAGLTEIVFPPAIAKFIRVTYTKAHHKIPWSIDEVEVMRPSPLATTGH
jgi:hypothetical protein